MRATGRTYTPEKTANFETLVKYEYHRQTKGFRFEDNVQIGIRVEAVFPIPKSVSKRNRAAMEAGIIRHVRKPDTDNILKAVADALNRIAYRDDSAIVYAEVTKRYGVTPGTNIMLWKITDGREVR